MSPIAAWLVVALGLLMLVSRRRSMCIVLMAMQSATVGVAAIVESQGRSAAFATAAAILVAKAVGITFFLALAVGRTRERTRIRADLDPLARLATTLVGIVIIELLVPPLGFIEPGTQQAVIAILGFGFAMVAMRRATLLQLMGILACENAIALAAVNAMEFSQARIPVIIELGAAADVIVFITVGLAFHHRIFEVLGSGDSAAMRELRD